MIGEKVTALFVNEAATFLIGSDNNLYTIKHSNYPNGPLTKVELRDHHLIRRVQQKTSLLKVISDFFFSLFEMVK